MIGNKTKNKKDITDEGLIIFIVTSLDDDDFSQIVDNVDDIDKVLIVSDKVSIDGYKHKDKIKFIIDDFKDKNLLCTKLKLWKKENKKGFSGIIGLDEEYQYSFSYRIAEEFSLKYYSKKTIKYCSNKYLQRKVLDINGVNVPSFELVTKDTKKYNISFPNVLKLTNGFASFYVLKNNNVDELRSSIDKMSNIEDSDDSFLNFETEENDDHEKRHDNVDTEKIDSKKEFILEEYVGGNEYSCDFIVTDDGKARVLRVTKKLLNKDYFAFFNGFILFNPDHEKESEFTLTELETVCQKISKSLEISYGVCMVDFKFFNGKIYIIETTIRPGISSFMILLSNIYKNTSFNHYFKQMQGKELDIRLSDEKGVVFYITTERLSGKVLEFNTSKIEKNKSDKYELIKIDRFYNVNDLLRGPPDGLNRPEWLGYVAIRKVKALSNDDVNKLILGIKKDITIEIEK